MTWLEWTAIIGAGAWLPQIINFVYRRLSKPLLTIISDSTIELGYSYFGPIFNISLAISTANKDALIEKMNLKIIHIKTKEEHEFIWKYLDEKGFEGTSSKGEILQTRKSQSAIAVKVGIIGLVEKKVLFNDFAYLFEKNEYENIVFEHDEFLKRTDPGNYPNSIFKSKELTNILDFIRTSFYWKEGDYKIYLYTHEKSSKKVHCDEFEFNLRSIDIQRLERNIETSQNFFQSTIALKTGLIKEFPSYFWNWIYPKIEK